MKTIELPKTENKLVAALPWFPGFYYSILDSFIDRETEMEMEEHGLEWGDVEKRFSYEDARDAIAREWVKAFAQETGIPVEWESMKSPREYNFTTDRVFITLPLEEWQRLRDRVNDCPIRETIRKNFTSRDGFISFYPSDLDAEEWQKPLAEWDHNQLMTLLEAWLVQEEHEESDFIFSLADHSRVYEAANAGWIN